MSTATAPSAAQDLGKKLVALCQQGKNQEAIDTLYADDVVSIEAMEMPGMPARTEGLAAVKARKKAFYDNSTIHSSTCEGPWPHGDRFIVTFSIDMTAKAGPMAGQRMQMKEAALFTVKNGKITQEEFFYGGC
ncbi:MAG TPA: nuclear transport factor 2 family protein [Phycisphaerales bacterium]|nr:nuclear transport factor 2 family protein [Phycisphaerales bacterium]